MRRLNVRIVLAILLLLSVGHIGFDVYSAKSSENTGSDEEVFTQGLQQGYEQAIIQVVQQAATCEQVPLRVEDQTINIIAVDCLQ